MFSFLAAVMFFTRIPLPVSMQITKEHFSSSAKFFPLVGWIVGGVSALVLYFSLFVLPLNVSIVLSIIATILITGAMHEDALADVCDGFGGGWDKERILAIMKDSHIGVFGVVGVVSVLLLRYVTLSGLESYRLPLFIIAANALSRFSAITFMYTHSYVRPLDDSKSKNVVEKLSLGSIIIAGIFGVLPLFFLSEGYKLLVIVPFVFLVKWLLGLYFNKWIGGYTGDCLGATQQINEVVIYLLFLIAPWKYF